ncbi:outer membrane protein OmpA-like peptidoglycan-associated protein [Paraburkholderia sp. BL6669N2]|uniref:OmpA family protein n=1 Tax=Paraburkholderia sp. BL6669N2 TaxID=1938807 RepID=UPI000E222441|nr:OmpA family protein [Paraburkholderia sp. BL6669N2]REG59932.1 outer membrane protein OmpA-like peptidoglycan-associated protein [Paraburkholderia sp. BL6669N2]
MNSTLFKYLRAPLLGAFVAALAACNTQSGATYTLHAISAPNQQARTYHVTCQGLFESSQACVRVAEETCKAQPVTWLESIDGVRNNEPKKDPREATFMCGTPAVQQPVTQPVVQQPAPVVIAQQQPAPQPQATVQQRRLLLQGNANFATDSSVLSAVAKDNLDQFLRVNKEVHLRRVTVIGYTDKTGSEPHNRMLSEARAAAVVAYLRDGGLQADQFSSKGMGSADPVATNATAEGRMQNRRVDVRVFAE